MTRVLAPSKVFLAVLAAAALACGDDPQSPDTGDPGAAASSGLAADVTAAATYTVKDLGTLGGTSAMANGINDQGGVVGWSTLVNGRQRAFLWRAGKMKDLGALAGGTAEANDINASDVVVGWSTVANGAQHAARWENGKVRNLGTLGGRNSVATAINDAGIIVGYSDLKNGQTHAFVYQNGVMTDLGAPLGGNSVALDINRAGKIVGASGTHAVTWKNGVFKDLGDNGHEYATAAAINLKGQIGAIVGPFLDAEGEERDASFPYLFYQDKWTSIGGASITNEVHAINNAGLVVGSGLDLRDESFRERAFVSKPGSSTILPPLTPGGVDEDRANDINSFGTIVGSSTEVIGNGTGPNHAVLWRQ